MKGELVDVHGWGGSYSVVIRRGDVVRTASGNHTMLQAYRLALHLANDDEARERYWAENAASERSLEVL